MNKKNSKIIVEGSEITIFVVDKQEFISLTDYGKRY